MTAYDVLAFLAGVLVGAIPGVLASLVTLRVLRWRNERKATR